MARGNLRPLELCVRTPVRAPARVRTVLSFIRALVVGAAAAMVAVCAPASSAMAATLTRGPYLQRLGTDTVTIVWNTDVAAACAARIRSVAGATTVVPGAAGKVCAVTVNGLEPGTTYGYTPLAGGSPVAGEGAFRTAHPALPYTFLVFGDSGNGSADQMAVRDGMLATHADLILHTGDMIYPEAETAAWNPKYFGPYADLLRKLVLWPCLGNHDVRGDDGKSWRAAFFTPANNTLGKEDYYSFDHGNAHFVMLDSNESLAPGSAQLTFLDQDLAASTAAWNFVFFHHTIYSGGEHGSDLGLQARLVPLFDAHEVDVVFMGHDHHYERTWPMLANQIVQPGEGTSYITTGGGGAEIRDVEPRTFTAYAESSYHFVKVAVAGGALRLDMVRADGSIADSMSMLKGAPPACGDGIVNQVGEACDGADDVACPGRCDASCACTALCGDGMQQAPAEECDWLDDSQCPGLCIADCTCADDPGSLDLAPLADTYIEAGLNPAWDRGGATAIFVDAQPHRIAYLKFDLSAVTQPIARATLGLSCVNPSDKGGIIHPVADSSWIEGTGRGTGTAAAGPGLKWTDVDTSGDGLLDGADTSPYLPAFAEVITEIGPVAEDDRYLVDVRGALDGGLGLVTLAIAGGATDGAEYASREATAVASRPLLQIDFDLECRSDADCDDGVLCNGAEQCLRGHCAAGPEEDCDDGSSCTVDACDVLADECRHDPVADGSACDDGDLCTQVDECRDGACVGGAAVICGGSPDQCHGAAVCDPATGLCTAPPVADGTPCADGDACTQVDQCQAGVCVGADPVDCPAVDPCHAAGLCNPATGLCTNPPLPEGTPCEDGDLCTTGERCQARACTGGLPVVCAPADQCHAAGVCAPATGQCGSPPLADGAACDDGDACSQDDACQAGACVGGPPVVCVASGSCRTVGLCDPASGQCTSPPLEDGTACDDGNACTQRDVCLGGNCIGEDPVACPAPAPCHAAGVCDPASGQCTSPPLADGTACDDGDACTRTDACVGGSCVGGGPVVCTALGPCHVAGVCDPATGECTNPVLADGTACDDGNACTQGQGEVCQAGACVGGAPVVCPAPAPCRSAGVCDPANGQCTSPPVADGTACDDGNACTTADTCQAGTCVGSAPVVCPAPAPCHVAGVCDPATGACTNPVLADGTVCDDGDACSQGDVCHAGLCVGGPAVICPAPAPCRSAGVCDPASGQCTSPPVADGTACDDGNACTTADACQAGACVGGAPVVCPAPAPCRAAGVCDPANGQCTSPPVANGTACDDGNACTRSDACVGGSCAGGNPVVCVVSGQCEASGVCDPETGACMVVPKVDGTSCSDGNPCTVGDSCHVGACVSGPPMACAPLDQCHALGACNPVTGQCTHPAKPNGAACDDGNPCTLTDTCQSGVCSPGPARQCAPLDQCHQAGTCQRANGQCTNPPRVNGSACDDGNPCTQADSCQAGMCVGGLPVTCVPLDACHRAGVCDPATGCSDPEAPDGTPCDDGSICTEGDACQGGVCAGTAPVPCEPLDQCHDAGACDPVTGVCSQPAKADGTPCDDGDACTEGDVCIAGTCVTGAQVECAPLDQCHDAGACDPATGLCSQPVKVDGAPCDDGDACTQGDACMAGACVAGPPVACTPLDGCHDAGTCDPATGLCSQPARADGTPCDDGDRCTVGDACRAGACAGGAPVVCTPVNGCHVSSCEPATGLCSQVAKADGAACDDGDRCTVGDACRAGACAAQGPSECTPLDACHDAGACDPATGLCSQPAKADGTPCDDGDHCTRQDACAGGSCVGGDPVTCTAIDQCHEAGACDPATGTCSRPVKPDGTPCDDGAFCSMSDACAAGVCRGVARECAGGPCRDGACDEGIDACTLRPKADGLGCDDGAYCTVGDACQAGLCTGAPRVCAAGDPCRVGHCEETFDVCLIEPGPDGTPCDDGAFCTVSDACAGGTCRGTPRDCGAPEAVEVAVCHDRVCDEAIDACTVRPEPNGAGCDDGAYCTVADACRDGTCRGTPRDCRVAVTGRCQDGMCDEVRDACSTRLKPDGSACSDTDACTRSDVCVGGVCRGGDRVECTPDDPCRLAGVCDPATGVCSSPPRLDGARCDDGDACTVADRCLDGRCTGDPLPDADADGVCDDVDLCPLVADPAQADGDGDGVGDQCQCTAPAPGRCIAGGGSRRTDCLLEFLTTGRLSFNRRGTRLRSAVWCTDGDPVCDVDGARDGVCTFGVALCFASADPRYSSCAPFPVRSVEVLSPSTSGKLPPDQQQNVQALEGAAQALGLQVRHGGRIIAPALRPVGDGLCGPLVHVTVPAPAVEGSRGIQRTLKLRAVAADGRRDQDRLGLMCER